MRANLMLGLAMAILVSSATAFAGREHRPTYVLVHGGFHGGWAWQEVAARLRESGAVVYTPTLTGLGDRAHMAQPNVGLGVHVQDIVAMLEFEDLRDVILVGHSYSGMVITGVAAAVPGRVKSLVYCDAAIPESGQSFFDAIAFPGSLPPGMTMLEPFSPQFFGVTDPAQIAFVGARLRPQPLASFQEPLSFNWEALANISKVYIHCAGEWSDKASFLPFRAKAQARSWTYFEVAAGHDVMITAPQELSSILLRLRR